MAGAHRPSRCAPSTVSRSSSDISANLYSLRVDGSVDAHPGDARPRARRRRAGRVARAGAAVPPLFLHATYQPHVSIGFGSTDGRRHARRRSRRGGARCSRRARDGVTGSRRSAGSPSLVAAAASPCWRCSSLATPSLLGEDYDYATHPVSALKFALVRAARSRRPCCSSAAQPTAGPCSARVVAWSVAATAVGALQFLGLVDEFEGKRPGQREPSFVGIHDFAALSGAALALGLVGARARPAATARPRLDACRRSRRAGSASSSPARDRASPGSGSQRGVLLAAPTRPGRRGGRRGRGRRRSPSPLGRR